MKTDIAKFIELYHSVGIPVQMEWVEQGMDILETHPEAYYYIWMENQLIEKTEGELDYGVLIFFDINSKFVCQTFARL